MDIDAQDNSFERTKVLAEQTKGPHLTILLTGRTPANKTSGITPLNTESPPEDSSRQSNTDIAHYNCVINGIPCQIVDSSVLFTVPHEVAFAQAYIEEIRTKISTIHCIWFTTRIDETHVSVDEQNAIKWITALLGEQAWNYALLLFTHANTAKTSWKCATMMKKRSEKFRAEISKYTGWDIASAITSVPVTTIDEIICAEQNWVPEIYTRLLRGADQKGIAQHFFPETVVKDNPSSKKIVRESASQWNEIRSDEEEEKLTQDFLCHMNTLVRCYIWSAPAGVIGMCLGGPEGFGIALAGNALFWIVLGCLQVLRAP